MTIFIIALQGLRGYPVRSLLVVVALTLGMLGFVAVLSADQVMREAVTQRALLAGGPETTVEASIRGPATEADMIGAADRLQQRLGATASAATIEDQTVSLWQDGRVADAVGVTFASPTLRDVRPFRQERGAWLTEDSLRAPRVVANEAAFAGIGADSALDIGTADVRIRVVVSGVVRDGESDPRVYVNIADYARFSEGTPTFSVLLTAPVLHAADVRATVSQLASMGAPYEVLDIRRIDRVALLAAEVATTSQVLFVLGALSIASTIVGIMNVGLSTARSRAKEFTLRRTMGATRAQIALIVMMESQILAVASALVAFGASFALFPFVVGAFGERLGIAPPPYEAAYGLVCLVVASATAAASSLVPALLSYRRDISSVMRE